MYWLYTNLRDVLQYIPGLVVDMLVVLLHNNLLLCEDLRVLICFVVLKGDDIFSVLQRLIRYLRDYSLKHKKFFSYWHQLHRIQLICLVSSVILFLYISYIVSSYDNNTGFFQFSVTLNVLGFYFYSGVDGLSLLFIYIASFLVPLCILFTFTYAGLLQGPYAVSIIAVGFLVLMVFSTFDLFLFYIFFEAILIPFFFLICISVGSSRKVHAYYLLFFYTIVGSVLMFSGILSIVLHSGTSNIQILSNYIFLGIQESFVWLCFALSLSIKVPVYPFHTWLPEAHVEAPTEASVLLAAVLLKIGIYGYLRIVFPIFPVLSSYYSVFFICLNSISLLYVSFTTLKQCDIKRILAYSSIIHMNVCMIGIFSFDLDGIIGSLILMFGHGFVSGGLFFLVGMLYSRMKTRLIMYYSGLATVMPVWCGFFFFFMLSNTSFPGTSTFIGELLVLQYAVYNLDICVLFCVCFSAFICTCYSILTFSKISFGVLAYHSVAYCSDLTRLEQFILFPITIIVLYTGISPSSVIQVFSIDLFSFFLVLSNI